jgi:hypothetical protein
MDASEDESIQNMSVNLHGMQVSGEVTDRREENINGKGK